VQGATEVALTGLDVLGYLERIPICTAYEVDGASTRQFPTTRRLERATPRYELHDGWRSAIGDVRRFDELPERARAYVLRLEALIEVPIRWVSVGPRRDQLIDRG
jgi:adenylosuccinate synthase